MMRARWLTVALVPLGTLAGHGLGYLLAGQDPALSGAHSHLRPVLWPAVAATSAGLASLALARTPPGRRGPRTSALVVTQLFLFGLLEAVEHVHAGHHGLSFAAEPSFRWGLAAQLASAGLLVLAARAVHLSGRLVRGLLSPRTLVVRPASRQGWVRLGQSISVVTPTPSISERGPPGRLTAA